MGLDDDTAAEAVEGSEPCGATAALVEETTEPISVAPEEEHELVLAYDSPEEMANWPRRVRARRSTGGAHAVTLELYYPEAATHELKFIPFTTTMFESWLTSRGESRDARAIATWGTKTTLQLTVSKLVAGALVFDPTATDAQISVDVYNLDPSQPKWRRVLERSLAILPISHLQAIDFRSVFLDFRVGTNRIGARGQVGDGGTNWRARVDHGVRTATAGIDPEGCSALCATFAALNRAWGQRDVADSHLPSTEAALDGSFDDPNYVMFTFFHELGHQFDYSGGTRAVAGRNALWGRYRDAIHYHGESDGDGEGFAEAYRQRMLGQALAPHAGTLTAQELSHHRVELTAEECSTTVTEMNAALDRLGMPSLESVRSAWTAIRAHFGGG